MEIGAVVPVRCGSDSRLTSHARFRSARGIPLMNSRPLTLWKTISTRRGLPVLRPVVVMSMVWPRASARLIWSFM